MRHTDCFLSFLMVNFTQIFEVIPKVKIPLNRTLCWSNSSGALAFRLKKSPLI